LEQLADDEKEIKEWVEQTVDTDDGLITILENFLRKSYTDFGIDTVLIQLILSRT